MPEEVHDAIALLREQEPSSWFDAGDWRIRLLVVLIALTVVGVVLRRLRRFIRRRRRPTIHPKLQKYGEGYGEPSAELAAQRRSEAARIVATSSTAVIAGYEIVEQVEAVFVDGFRRPEEALEGLKAAAAMKGANAVSNVRLERAASGKCSAAGDGVVVRRVKERASASVKTNTESAGDTTARG